mmetsp:Transcript_58525/g.127099  ORF Transcript_58525/g.127099 Transcript_58525/m.127099 type:complete len:249 (+) Transcript_58525:768-1514(+)
MRRRRVQRLRHRIDLLGRLGLRLGLRAGQLRARMLRARCHCLDACDGGVRSRNRTSPRRHTRARGLAHGLSIASGAKVKAQAGRRRCGDGAVTARACSRSRRRDHRRHPQRKRRAVFARAAAALARRRRRALPRPRHAAARLPAARRARERPAARRVVLAAHTPRAAAAAGAAKRRGRAPLRSNRAASVRLLGAASPGALRPAPSWPRADQAPLAYCERARAAHAARADDRRRAGGSAGPHLWSRSRF